MRSTSLLLGTLVLATACGAHDGADDAATDTEMSGTEGPTGSTGAVPSAGTTSGTTQALAESSSSSSGLASTGEPDDDTGSSDSTGAPVVCDPPESLGVLFIGNSFTFTHDLPGMVADLGTSAALPIVTDSITQGGQRLSYHVQNEATLPLIQSQPWDYVVIQGHSLETLDDLEGFLSNGETLVGWIEDAGAQPLLYETWARSPAHNLYDDPNFDYATPDQMQAGIHDGYQMLSDLTGARVVPAGTAWQLLWSSNAVETVYPWGGDEYHPSVAGTYLNASVFFVAMTGLSMETVEGPQPVEPDAAEVLHAIAEQAVPPAADLRACVALALRS